MDLNGFASKEINKKYYVKEKKNICKQFRIGLQSRQFPPKLEWTACAI